MPRGVYLHHRPSEETLEKISRGVKIHVAQHPMTLEQKTLRSIQAKKRWQDPEFKTRMSPILSAARKNVIPWIAGKTKEEYPQLSHRGGFSRECFSQTKDKHHIKVSRPQKLMLDIVKSKVGSDLDVRLNHYVKTSRSYRFIDVAIPSLKLGFEFDGKHWHQNVDKARDKELIDQGWTIAHINEDGFMRLERSGR